MGYNTTLLVLNDALGHIEKDPDFGKKISSAIGEIACYRKPVDIASMGHCNAATVLETHHADQSAIVAVGGNYGTVLGTIWGWSHHERDKQEQMLRELAGQFGFNLVRKPVRR